MIYQAISQTPSSLYIASFINKPLRKFIKLTVANKDQRSLYICLNLLRAAFFATDIFKEPKELGTVDTSNTTYVRVFLTHALHPRGTFNPNNSPPTSI